MAKKRKLQMRLVKTEIDGRPYVRIDTRDAGWTDWDWSGAYPVFDLRKPNVYWTDPMIDARILEELTRLVDLGYEFVAR